MSATLVLIIFVALVVFMLTTQYDYYLEQEKIRRMKKERKREARRRGRR